MHKITLIVLSAGDSSRFQTKKIPKKQWLRIGELPLWLKVAQEISSYYPFNKVLISAKECEKKYMQRYLDSFGLDFLLTTGGETRQESLKNALSQVDEEFVLVSDVARCSIPRSIFDTILLEANNYDCVVPYIPINDTIAYDKDGLEYLQREQIKIIQTPQLSKTKILKNALGNHTYTDESSAIYANGGKVGFVLGSLQSRKLTSLEDLSSLSLPPPDKKTLIGCGSDIHALKKGEGILLGGVFIPCEFKLIAHSDGDVCLHALSDAILGGIGAGDIGEWFPDNDETYKNADSAKLLEQITNFTLNVGYTIQQVDITIFAQKPKISPYKQAIEKNIAKLLGIPLFCVNVKATTTEKLGFIGRQEGILVHSNVVLTYFQWHNKTNEEQQ
ncbi:bifunctional 2-C-methyl-D-erythritol 4-phosphate cytidylyltransferase/2-C-methyl-D-erythritol 2,4-cyclodiphosphate synthase [Helicobacter apodemus]|uniref:Bifunctional enzyme IspD/IspF n=1 Tax=Helicobacter apodemus TaxID=135569 RepID=A0A2U8FFD2_9HELI|nr:bifunctional 2-C-methyl-D-erythritol 4-phosphate cytidylyltransferase/2-C-methyl-D-erythritol 2,4-cyclodiphosphate synthase [Helicobacter apodemus]AWI34135.1 bifunctional 2-C-methyl-D-erythritol 4-phosphate cytidylyltransferase/2-C-methyl-D-erythritol 2,4-cyclodiphosphate synthase [Helicobacter apodemus]